MEDLINDLNGIIKELEAYPHSDFREGYIYGLKAVLKRLDELKEAGHEADH